MGEPLRIKHYANIDDKGKLILSNHDAFKEELKKLSGKRVYVIVDEEKPTRSNNQNRYYWSVVVGTLSNELGYTPEEMHEVLKTKFSPKDIKQIGAEQVVIPKSTTRQKTDEFETYLESIRRFALLELNIKIALPNEIEVSDD